MQDFIPGLNAGQRAKIQALNALFQLTEIYLSTDKSTQEIFLEFRGRSRYCVDIAAGVP